MKSEKMIPEIYVQSADIRTLCRIFDIEYDLLLYYTNHILDCYSPEHCQEHLLPELAEHIGFDYNELKTVMYNRVVLKHFIRDLIRYRGSKMGIANAAAIDIRYRQVYPAQFLNPQTGQWEDDPEAGNLVPMTYNEGIPIERTWIDTDNQNGIIYLFIISPGYFPPIPNDASDEVKQELANERMRRLLDLSHLQEYVRPAGMYLLPMVAEKVDARTDLTVKAIRIPTEERNLKNGVTGTPNASLEHRYDRMHFAKVENPGDADEGTNKNLLINLFQVDDSDESQYTGASDVLIAGKGTVPRNPVPYAPAENDSPTGSDAMYTVRNAEGPEDEPLVP